MDKLKERVEQFNRLGLPGQPMAMHMGTSYLVNDLYNEVERLRSVLAAGSCDHSMAVDNDPVCPGCLKYLG